MSSSAFDYSLLDDDQLSKMPKFDDGSPPRFLIIGIIVFIVISVVIAGVMLWVFHGSGSNNTGTATSTSTATSIY